MDRPFLCPDCGLEHDEPAHADLGHLVRCFDCALTAEMLAYQETIVVSAVVPAIAA